MVPSFLDPTPVTLKSVLPWEDFMTQVEEALEREADALLGAVTEAAASVMPELGGSTHKALQDAADAGDLRSELTRQLVLLTVVRVYVADPIEGKAFPIKPHFWGLVPTDAFDVDETIQLGRLTFDEPAFPEGSLERRMANMPLFVHREDLATFFKLRPSSRAAAGQAANDAIQTFLSRTPGGRMRKADFIAEMQERLGISARQAERLWAEHAPEDWRKSGTKSPGARRQRGSN